MEVPLEVILTFGRGHAAVVAIVLLEASKVALQTISCWWDARIIEKMEHVGDGFEQHATCSLKIAEDFTVFRLSIDERAVA